ncbi:MAG: malate synthase A [Nanoarchaeota archaeon]|nr:malate synthase A [Nanoarchaeota archaeon]
MDLENKITFRDSIKNSFQNDLVKEVLTPEALRFVAELAGECTDKRNLLLAARRNYNAEETPHFLESTKHIRNDKNWKVAKHPQDLQKRWVEITGPASNRKMVINALNSGADCYMADFEDSDVPTWENLMQGQKNLIEAARGAIEYTDPKTGKQYTLHDQTATLLVRPRGWHLDEKHVLFEGKPIPGALFDFGLFFYHNARKQQEKGSTPTFYLPKMESHLEARLWNDVFQKAQDMLDIGEGTIRATVLIETLPAAFEMEEILYELKDHISGLNCGRWDYIFSYIKKLNQHQDKIVPDRDQVSMTQPFLQSYVDLLIQTCHKRGAYAMGGMAAQIPLKDREANEKAMAAVRTDKEREVAAGHDGTWVAHPGLVPIARDIFEKGMNGANNQLYRLREEVQVTEEDLLKVPEGSFTYDGFKKNINIGIRYVEAYLRGIGCVPLEGKMEDAATAEISRAQDWQWLRHQVKLDDGRMVTPKLYTEAHTEVTAEIMKELGQEKYITNSKFPEATNLFLNMIEQEQKGYFEDFLTIPAYEHLIKEGR